MLTPRVFQGTHILDTVPKQESRESYFCQLMADFSFTSAAVDILFPVKLQIALKEEKDLFFIMMTLNQLQLSNKTDVGQQKWRKVHWIDSKGNNCETIHYSGALSQHRNANSFHVDSPSFPTARSADKCRRC